jgi:hypothetical protein
MREDDKLILRSENNIHQGAGVLFLMMGLFVTWQSWFTSTLGWLVLAAPFVVIGGFLLLFFEI